MRGACPVGCLLDLPLRYQTGVLAVFVAYLHCLLFLFCPHPPDPRSQSALPNGKGGPRLFYARGFAPCIPGDEPGRHWLSLPYKYPCGCLPGWSPDNHALTFLFFPHPPAPSRREGGDQGYFYARGYRPRHPGIKPLAALTVPAKPALRREAYPENSTDSVRASGRVFPRK